MKLFSTLELTALEIFIMWPGTKRTITQDNVIGKVQNIIIIHIFQMRKLSQEC